MEITKQHTTEVEVNCGLVVLGPTIVRNPTVESLRALAAKHRRMGLQKAAEIFDAKADRMEAEQK